MRVFWNVFQNKFPFPQTSQFSWHRQKFFFELQKFRSEPYTSTIVSIPNIIIFFEIRLLKCFFFSWNLCSSAKFIDLCSKAIELDRCSYFISCSSRLGNCRCFCFVSFLKQKHPSFFRNYHVKSPFQEASRRLLTASHDITRRTRSLDMVLPKHF